jgi:ABC-type branched-subunit amino acid transport system substrate-binding protein
VLGFRSLASSPRGLWLALALLSASAVAGCGGYRVTAPPPVQQERPAVTPPPPVEQPAPTPAPPSPVTQEPLPAGAQVPVALLLPLTGPSAALGQGMLDAALLAVNDVGAEQIKLLPHDTGTDPQRAADAARTAIADGARLIVGPLLASDVEAVKPIAQAAHVPVLAFSTTASIAGDGVYLLSFQPRQEVAQVVAYAHARGVNRFAIFAPHTAYGALAAAAMQQAVAANQSQLVESAYYPPDLQSLDAATKEFAQRGHDYDALLLPDGGRRLKALAPYLDYYHINSRRIHFLGTGLWDDDSLGNEAVLVHGWYAAPDPQGRANFDKRFAAAEGHPPPRLATLAYDATALAAVLAKSPGGPDFSEAALTNPSGFVGLDGVFRLHRDGLVERGLAVLQVEPGGPKVIGPAPQSFVAAATQ